VTAGIAASATAQTITLHGASQFNDDHAFTKALVRFEELVKKYYGKPSVSCCTRIASLASRRTTSPT